MANNKNTPDTHKQVILNVGQANGWKFNGQIKQFEQDVAEVTV